MKVNIARATVLSMMIAGALVACNPADGSKDKTTESTTNAAATSDTIKGLNGDKEQYGYVLGRDMADSLKPGKEEIDLDMVIKGLKEGWKGEKSLVTEEQASKIRESLGTKMQAKQVAEMLATTRKNAEEGAKFLAENGKKPGVITTPSGLQYQVIQKGTGAKIKPNDIVQINYKGSLIDGKVFDNSADHGGPAAFQPTGVVPGLREAMSLMSVGGKYKVFIPSNLAYGEQGTPGGPIPPNSTLLFDIEVVGLGAPKRDAAAQR